MGAIPAPPVPSGLVYRCPRPPAAGATRMMHTRPQFIHPPRCAPPLTPPSPPAPRAGPAAPRGPRPPRPVRAQAIGPVKILYGFSAGSAGDTVARRVGDKLAGSAYTSHAAVVENKPGASGRIALELLKTAPGDGSVLALAPFSCTAIYPHIYRQLSYDPANDFQPVSIAAIMHHALAVGPLVPPHLSPHLPPAQLRPGQRFPAGVDRCDHAPRPGGGAAGAGVGQDDQRLPGLGQGQPGAGQLWLARRRLDPALHWRPVRSRQRGRAPACALSRLHTWRDRSGGRADCGHGDPQRGLHRLLQGRQAAAAGHLGPCALTVYAGCAHFRRAGPCGTEHRGVARLLRPGQDRRPRRGRRQCGDQRRRQGTGGHRQPGPGRADCQGIDPGRDALFPASRVRALGPAGQESRLHRRFLSRRRLPQAALALRLRSILVSRHGSDVVGCAQPSERSARRIACPYRAVLASDATPRCASMASSSWRSVCFVLSPSTTLTPTLILANCAFTCGSSSARRSVAASRSWIGAGVAAGTNKPTHATKSALGEPASRTVGTWGRSGERVAEVMAKARSCPCLTRCTEPKVVSKPMLTWPASTACTHCGPLL